MPRSTYSALDRMVRRRADQRPIPARPKPPVMAADRFGWRLVAAALGLSIAGVSAPIAVAAIAEAGGSLGPPLALSILVALLVLEPAGVGLIIALSGLRGIAAALAARGDNEAEQAVLRVLVQAMIFCYALGLAAASGKTDGMPPYLALAAFGLVAAWALLLLIILRPAAPPLRRRAAMIFDILLFSAFLQKGGAAAAGLYPLYLLTILYAGFRFGLRALVAAATASILGFAAVIVTTEAWREQPGLAAGLLLALAVLPGSIVGAIRAIASARERTAEADADRHRILGLIAEGLRGPLAAARAIGADASSIEDVLDFAALEAGTFAPPIETFDLRVLVKDSLGPLQADAAEQGVLLRWRIDPQLPVRLRGRAQALARILVGLAGHAVEANAAGTARIALDAAAGDSRRLRLRVSVEKSEREFALEPNDEEGALALLVVRRLAALTGGTYTIARTSGQRTRVAVTLAFAIEEGAALPDLANIRVLIASADGQFAGGLAELLGAWRGEARWVGDSETALAALAHDEATERAIVMIIDGRRKLLSALSLAHQAAGIGGPAPLVLLVADAGQIDSLGAVDDGAVDGFIPAPVSARLLANALHGLPLEAPLPERALSPPVAPPQELADEPPADPAERITSIAAHPKFVPESAALDTRALDGLHALGGDPDFLGEVIEAFRADSRQIVLRLEEAVAAADAAGFAQSLNALRRAATPLGGTQLCALLASLQDLTTIELRRLGGSHVQRIAAEVTRLADALAAYRPATETNLS